MYVTAITPGTYNQYGAIILRQLPEINRDIETRMSRTMNMDGSTTIIRSGFSSADQTVSIRAEFTAEQEDALRYWAENDIGICIYRRGVEFGYIKKVSGTAGNLTITIWKDSNFGVLEPTPVDTGGGGGGGGEG